jgi:glucose/arabinose dehydrogenase
MRRLQVLLILPLLACGGLSEIPPATIPTSTTTATEVPPVGAATISPPVLDTPAAPPTPIPTVQVSNAPNFPNINLYEWRLVTSGLIRPVDIQAAYDGSGRLFIIEKYGTIRLFVNGTLFTEPFLDISDRVNDSSNEMGLLGLAFHPDFKQNGYLYVNYTGPGGDTYISRFQASGNTADPASEKILLTIDQPYPNHNGGAVTFGPDEYLYLALGDGGLAGDPLKNGQNTNSLLGKILRIDVDNGDPYTIPPDNPFGNEVWAYGLRNPWRISFDRQNGDLWIGDVGQNKWEEIDYLPAGSPLGANFGWSIMEATHPFDGDAREGLILPVVEYGHDFGCSVIGGIAYRGSMTEYSGIYFYGDYCSGTVWGLHHSNGKWENRILFETRANITTFGTDEAGELHFAGDNGNIYIMVRK